jgi:hypothetical protein
MKANELRLGDYVYSTFSNKPCKVIKLESSPEGYGSVCVDGVSGRKDVASLTPIPLTAEILEKNLSTTSQIQYCWDDFLSNSFGKDFYEIRYHGDVTELVISIRYVHELQHVLKLCKIEKEITL